MNIHVHIERLVLDGRPVTTAQGPLVQAGLEAELTRLLAEYGLRKAVSRTEPRAPASHFQIGEQGSTRQIGQQIGQAVYNIMNQPLRQASPCTP